MTSPADKLAVLQTIIRDCERLRDLANQSGNEFFAHLLDNVVVEARATLAAQGISPATTEAERS